MEAAALESMTAYTEAVERGELVAMATVVRVQKGFPVPLGSKMVVWLRERVLGSLGDSKMEEEVIERSREAILAGHATSFVYPPTTTRTLRARRAAEAEVYVEVPEAPTALVVGGGHIGHAVAKIAKMCGFQVAVVDDRPDFANAERFPEADQIICGDFVESLKEFPVTNQTYIVVVTRGHQQDQVSLRQVIDSPAAYIGMIGSRRRASAVLQHIRDSGVPTELIARVRSPIGLHIGAETPAEIAVCIVAEMIMTRHGGTGRPMSEVERLTVR